MKTSETIIRRLFWSPFAALTIFFLCLSRGNSQVPAANLITVRAAVRDNYGKPPAFATLYALDQDGNAVENPDLTVRRSGSEKLENQYPKSAKHYFITVSAAGCFDSAPQKISGLHDANLKFVLKRRPKAIKPKIKKRQAVARAHNDDDEGF